MKDNTIINFGSITITVEGNLGYIILKCPYVRYRTYDARLESYEKMKKFAKLRYLEELKKHYGEGNPITIGG